MSRSAYLTANREDLCKKRGTHRVDMNGPCLQLLTNPPQPVRYCVDCGAQVKVQLDSPQKIYAEVRI